ncbi:MAG: helix-hairpin-helix domain-containing protein, partial [Armatimonadota bacterium]
PVDSGGDLGMKRPNKKQGIAFVLALVVIVVITVLLTAASQRVSREMNTRIASEDEAKAEMAARAGVQRAIAELTTFNANLLQPQTDDWAQLGASSVGQFGTVNFKMARNTSFRLQVVDAGSFVNLNVAPQEQLQNLGLTDEQVDSLLDWRETGTTPRQLGAKDEYYNNLQTPYNTKLGKLDTISEILLVKGFTAQAILAPPTNTTTQPLVSNGSTQPTLLSLSTVDSQCNNLDEQGNAKIDINNASQNQLTQEGIAPLLAAAIIQRRQTQGNFTTLGQVFSLPGATANGAEILNRFTATTDQVLYGKINLNTASEGVLRSIPNLQSQAVDSILGNQGGYTTLGDLATIGGIQATDLVNLADVFTVGSTMLVVRSLGKFGDKEVGVEAYLDMTSQPPKVRRIERVIPADPVAYWGWQTETNQEITLMESSQ